MDQWVDYITKFIVFCSATEAQEKMRWVLGDLLQEKASHTEQESNFYSAVLASPKKRKIYREPNEDVPLDDIDVNSLTRRESLSVILLPPV